VRNFKNNRKIGYDNVDEYLQTKPNIGNDDDNGNVETGHALSLQRQRQRQQTTTTVTNKIKNG